ncbi:MAG: hypothetical protein HOK81_04270 [Rhodospirillaceae bacterium]|jgi:hypothetical protein|nr:hypothetical protein [Rhodospirillaceae bacterium]
MDDLNKYSQRYLRQWDKRATVRGMKRYRVTKKETAKDLFPADQQPLATHPDVTALGKDAVRELLIRTVYKWQGDIAALEVDVVTDLCGKLANQPVSFDLPDSARHAALTIGTDEVYHAYAAREFIADVWRHTGVDPEKIAETEYPILNGLAYLRQAAPPELLREAETMALCFAENFVTESLFGMAKNTEPDNPFHVTMREHLIDEGRHQNFFQALMRHMWAGIDEEARVALGKLIPGFLDAFLLNIGPIRESYAEILGFLGFEHERGLEMVTEAYVANHGQWDGRKDNVVFGQRCMNLVKVANILDHAPTRTAMIESGWVSA